MLRMVAFRLSLRVLALAMCSAAIAVSVSPASARPYHHGSGRHVRAWHAGHHAGWHQHRHRHFRYAVSNRHRGIARMQPRGLANTYISVTPDSALAPSAGFASSGIVAETRPRYRQSHQSRQLRRVARAANWDRSVAQTRARGLADTQASVPPNLAPAALAGGVGSSNIVTEARRYLGGNPTGRGSLWCARFMNMVLQHTGHRGTGSDMASSFAKYGQRVSGPQVGAIAVMTRGRGGGHVGIITGIDAKGNPIMISGNNGNRVREAPVSRGRIYAYVMPN
ncbi:TIGR02594 family protein [Bradyrhizobium lablabi]|nr:TIGR02594 family protein [Bradyrhizobium lablabi]MBR1121459.1 TIGR02594 family protein [Bradyrhizobium lablabi]